MALAQMFHRSSKTEMRCDQIHRICEGYAQTAFSKLKDQTPTTLVALYWGIATAYVLNGATTAWDFTHDECSQFELRMSRAFVDWFLKGIGSTSKDAVSAANQLFDASCVEGKIIMGLVWTNEGISDGLKAWSQQHTWGRDLLDCDGLVGGVSVLTITGVIHDTRLALNG